MNLNQSQVFWAWHTRAKPESRSLELHKTHFHRQAKITFVTPIVRVAHTTSKQCSQDFCDFKRNVGVTLMTRWSRPGHKNGQRSVWWSTQIQKGQNIFSAQRVQDIDVLFQRKDSQTHISPNLNDSQTVKPSNDRAASNRTLFLTLQYSGVFAVNQSMESLFSHEM